jgi:hypothetical protein
MIAQIGRAGKGAGAAAAVAPCRAHDALCAKSPKFCAPFHAELTLAGRGNI